MMNYRFRLIGVPPDQALKSIEVDPDLTVAQIKRLVQRSYKLNEILHINFIFKGKVLPDEMKFSKIGIHPKKDVITVMSHQAGGATRELSNPHLSNTIQEPCLEHGYAMPELPGTSSYKFRLIGIPGDFHHVWMDCFPHETVGAVKRRIGDMFDLEQKAAFILKGKIIPDSKRMRDLGIEPGAKKITILVAC